MHRKLTDEQIVAECRELLSQHRRVTVRDVSDALRARFGGPGRNRRAVRILDSLHDKVSFIAKSEQSEASHSELTRQLHASQQQLSKAREQITRLEKLADGYQDFWARRYADKLVELDDKLKRLDTLEALERKRAVSRNQERPAISPTDYWRVHQRAAELARRLAEYEPVDANGQLPGPKRPSSDGYQELEPGKPATPAAPQKGLRGTTGGSSG
jgi:hypothetical protein